MPLKNIKKGNLLHGDCLHRLKEYPSNAIDALVSDPPYGISYYGLNWDKAIPSQEIWKECYRVLKPGAFAFIMSSVRQDVLSRMIITLEKAGFDSRFSSLYWTYTTGFPKASNIGISIDKKLGITSKTIETKIQERVKFKDMRELGMKGNFCDPTRIEYHVKEPASQAGKELQGGYAGFQPRPAVEAILVVMKPLSEKTYVDQALSNSKGVTFLGDCSIPYIDGKMQPQKRFMSNLIVSDNSLDLCGESNIEIECRSKAGYSYKFSLDAWAKDALPHLIVEKAKKEKDLGLENLSYDNIVNREPGQRSFNVPMKQRPSDRKNIHPTVKPLKLMSYLITLGSRPGDIVLDPFCGSGTTCLAASILGRRFLGIEIEKKYFLIAKERLTNITGVVKDAVTQKSITPKMKSLSDIQSITLRYHDKSVFDVKAVKGLMTVAFHNPEAGVSIHDNVEITTTLKPEDSHLLDPA